MIRFPQPLLCLLTALSFLVRQTNAGTALDPVSENSTTRFGQALVALGDINGDGVPDLS
ncbi:MAG: integrin alpha [Chthoniobacterales bacterium]